MHVTDFDKKMPSSSNTVPLLGVLHSQSDTLATGKGVIVYRVPVISTFLTAYPYDRSFHAV